MNSLSGKTAMVVGASRGLGRGIAQAFSTSGASVIAVARDEAFCFYYPENLELLIEEGAVLGANVTITGSTPIIDVTGNEAITHHGRVPARSVVVPGTRPKKYPAGEFQVGCALIVGTRTASTDRKTSLNQVLREFGVST